MLVLKINTYNYFGENHPEGCQKEEKYFQIDKNMTVKELEELIDSQIGNSLYTGKTFEIIKIQDIKKD